MKSFLLVLAATTAIAIPATADDLSKWGVEKSQSDTGTTRTTTYSYEVGRSGDHGYGFNGKTNSHYRDSHGERDTQANQTNNGPDVSGNVYIDW